MADQTLRSGFFCAALLHITVILGGEAVTGLVKDSLYCLFEGFQCLIGQDRVNFL